MENFEQLIRELCSYPSETQWIEFKHNNYDPETIGEDICALANGAALLERDKAYFLWGVENSTHKIVGTEHDLQSLRKGNEELENWLRGNLSANADFEYYLVPIAGVKVGIMIVHAALGRPVAFRKVEYIRVGSYTKKLIEYPEIQSRLWRRLQRGCFEDGTARRDLSAAQVVSLLDVSQYFLITGIPYPPDAEGVCHYLCEEGVTFKQDNGLYSISNMGAILFAQDLDNFPGVARKAVRVAQFEGNSRYALLK
nr:ATP-binding protein [Schwartzia sp. (in: firmicutes)]